MATGTIPLGLLEASAVREMANIGLGHATTALAELTGKTIDMSVPDAESVALEELPAMLGTEALTVGVYMPIAGDIDGHVAFVLPWSGAQRLWTMLLGAAPEGPEDIDALHASVLMEIGNIVDGGFLSAISDMTGLRLEASPPRLSIDMGIAVVAAIVCEAACADTAALAVRTTITESGEDLEGTFLFVPTLGGLRKLFKALGLPEEGI